MKPEKSFFPFFLLNFLVELKQQQKISYFLSDLEKISFKRRKNNFLEAILMSRLFAEKLKLNYDEFRTASFFVSFGFGWVFFFQQKIDFCSHKKIMNENFLEMKKKIFRFCNGRNLQ